MERPKNILFLITLPFRRLFVRRSQEINKVVIVQNAKLGDMVCTTPVFRATKAKYPNAKLAVVGDVINREILAGNPDVDLYITFDFDNWDAVLNQVRDFASDFGCVCTPDAHGLKLLLEAGVPLISSPKIENGWSPWETKMYKILRLFAVSVPHRMGSYAPREYLKLLEPIGIYAEDTSKHLEFSPVAGEFVERFISPGLNVGIAVSAGNKIKEWPVDRFASVADHLIHTHKAKIILIGGPSDRGKVEDLLSKSRYRKSITNTQGKLSVDELKALISKLDLFISVDTGPIYIAEAFGIPTVDVVGPVDEREQPPRGDMHEIVAPERTAPILFVMNAKVHNPAEARRQAESVSTLRVIEVVERLIQRMLQ